MTTDNNQNNRTALIIIITIFFIFELQISQQFPDALTQFTKASSIDSNQNIIAIAIVSIHINEASIDDCLYIYHADQLTNYGLNYFMAHNFNRQFIPQYTVLTNFITTINIKV